MLTNFNDIFNLTKSRINFVDADTVIDDVVKNGINQAYLEISKNENMVIATSSLTAVNGVITLPELCLDIVKIVQDIGSYNVYGNSLVTDYTSAVTIIYSTYLTPMTADGDIPSIAKKYWYLLTTYGCYSYYMYKKKEQEASFYLSEYKLGLDTLRTKVDQTQGKGMHYYTKLLGGV